MRILRHYTEVGGQRSEVRRQKWDPGPQTPVFGVWEPEPISRKYCEMGTQSEGRSHISVFCFPSSVFCFLSSIFCLLFMSSACFAVNSKVIRQNSSADFLKGKTENVVIGSRGTIQLGRAAESLIKEFKGFNDVWSINSIVVSGGTVYFGTSPNGGIYKYSLNKLTKIYPIQEKEFTAGSAGTFGTRDSSHEPAGSAVKTDANTVKDEEHLSNEHIFAMATDVSGRLLAGISGTKCRLCRFEGEKMETIFEPNDAKYIFAIAVGEGGSIYLGTGPEGKIYRLNSLGKEPEMIYDSRDKNILSLAVGADGYIYAGSDTRGLVYKINTRRKEVTVLYDSDQPEITALLTMPEGSDVSLYAAATSAKIVQTQTQFAATTFGETSAGRPEIEDKSEEALRRTGSKGDRKLEIANTQAAGESKPPSGPPPVRKGAKPAQASHIYKITGDGFVTDVFSEAAVFFCLADKDGKLFVGTGNNANLLSVDPAAEQQVIVYEDEQAAQITAIAISGQTVYLGTANPAKLITLGSSFASEGTYTSDLLDAGQPATWGKLQLDADIPQGCKVLVSARSGNVEDINDPTFSEWSKPVEITAPIQLQCPLGRFCQYKLILQSQYGTDSPLIREVAAACTVPNLAPQIESVTVSRVKGAGKDGVFKISFAAKDDNDDKLVYKIDFRKLGRTNWIQMKDDLETPSYEWDGKTVEDGRYEIRVTASDARSNTTLTELTGSRISDPVVVDNTGPVIKEMKITSPLKDDGKYRVLRIEVSDQLSAIGKLEYTIDSNDKWIGTVPDDLVYDTTDENFTIRIDAEKDLPKGDHVITVRVSDAVDNTTYKTLDVNVD
jgi:outer membrane protein assembly factor BamB